MKPSNTKEMIIMEKQDWRMSKQLLSEQQHLMPQLLLRINELPIELNLQKRQSHHKQLTKKFYSSYIELLNLLWRVNKPIANPHPFK